MAPENNSCRRSGRASGRLRSTRGTARPWRRSGAPRGRLSLSAPTQSLPSAPRPWTVNTRSKLASEKGRAAALPSTTTIPRTAATSATGFGRERHDLRRQRRRRAALGHQDAGRRDLNPEKPRCRKARRQQEKIKSGARSHFQNGARGQFLDGPHQQQQVHALRSHGSGEECPLPPRPAAAGRPLAPAAQPDRKPGHISSSYSRRTSRWPRLRQDQPGPSPAPAQVPGLCLDAQALLQPPGIVQGKPPRGSTEKRLSISSSLTWIIKAPERVGHGGRPHYLTLSVACPSDRPRAYLSVMRGRFGRASKPGRCCAAPDSNRYRRALGVLCYSERGRCPEFVP